MKDLIDFKSSLTIFNECLNFFFRYFLEANFHQSNVYDNCIDLMMKAINFNKTALVSANGNKL